MPVNRVNEAETLSAIGAGVLGAGLALLFAQWLQGFAIPVLLVGIAMHGWGMYEKHKLERGSGLARRKWEEAMYWSCWAALGALAIYIALRFFR